MTADEIVERARDLVVEELGVDPDLVVPDATFRSLGFDSLDEVELLIEVEKKFDIDISDEDAEKMMTSFGTLTAYLTERLCTESA